MAGRTTNPFTKTRADASVNPVTFTVGEVVSTGTGSTERDGAKESRSMVIEDRAEFPARSTTSSDTVFVPSTRDTSMEKEPSARTHARRPSTVRSTVDGSYVSVAEIDSVIRPRTSATSEGVGLAGVITVITGRTVSRMIVRSTTTSFPGFSAPSGSRWNQSAARTLKSFLPSASVKENEKSPSAPATKVDAPIETVAPGSVDPEIVAVERRVNRRAGPSRTRAGASVSTTTVRVTSTAFPAMSAKSMRTSCTPSARS